MISLRLVIGQGVRSVCRHSRTGAASLISFAVGWPESSSDIRLLGESTKPFMLKLSTSYLFIPAWASRCFSGFVHVVVEGAGRNAMSCMVLSLAGELLCSSCLAGNNSTGLEEAIMQECRYLLPAAVRVSPVYGLGFLV